MTSVSLNVYWKSEVLRIKTAKFTQVWYTFHYIFYFFSLKPLLFYCTIKSISIFNQYRVIKSMSAPILFRLFARRKKKSTQK